MNTKTTKIMLASIVLLIIIACNTTNPQPTSPSIKDKQPTQTTGQIGQQNARLIGKLEQ